MVKLSSAWGAVVVMKDNSTFLAMDPTTLRAISSLAWTALFDMDAFLRFAFEAFFASPPACMPCSSFVDSLTIGCDTDAASGGDVLVPFLGRGCLISTGSSAIFLFTFFSFPLRVARLLGEQWAFVDFSSTEELRVFTMAKGMGRSM